MTLASRLTALVQAIGADVKKLNEVSMLKPVDAAATGNVNVASAPATTAFDDVSGASWMTGRVLLHKQTNPAENGIWLYNTQGAPLVRADDVLKIKAGQTVYVRVGKTYGGKMFVSTLNAGPTESWGFVPLPYAAESIAEPCMKAYTVQQSLTVAVLDGSFSGKRVLLTAQTDKQENGVYTYDANSEILVRVTGEIYTPGRLFPVVTQSAVDIDVDWANPEIWACTEIGGTEGYTFAKVSGGTAQSTSASIPLRHVKNVVGATTVDFDGLEGSKAQQFIISVRGVYDGAPADGTFISVQPNKVATPVAESILHRLFNATGTAGAAATHDTQVNTSIIPIARTFAAVRNAITGRLTIDAVQTTQGQRTFFGQFSARREAGSYQHLNGEVHGWWEGGAHIDSLRILFGAAFTGSVVVESVTGEGIGSPVTTAKRVKGRVSSAGAVVAGSGFTSVRNAVGDYTVTFAPAFGVPPVVTLAIEGASGALAYKLLSTPAANTFRVLVYNSTTGANVDSAFGFVAEEPGLGLQATLDVGSWVTITQFLNSWVAYNTGGFVLPSYRVGADGKITLRGLVRNGVVGQPAFVLPFAPPGIEVFTVASPKTDVGPARVDVNPNGQVVPVLGSNVYFSLSGIEFYPN